MPRPARAARCRPGGRAAHQLRGRRPDQPGYHAELDELRQIARGGKDWIARFQASEIDAHRHRQPQGRLQSGVRLLHRDHPRPRQQDPRQLSAQADAQERRALHHAGAEGVRGKSPVRRGTQPAARIRAVRRPCAIRWPPRRPGCCRPARCWPSSTCWPPWPSWPCRATTSGPIMSRRADPGHPRRPASGAGSDAAAGDVCAQRRMLISAPDEDRPCFWLITGPNMSRQEHLHSPGGAADAAGPDGQFRAGRRGRRSAWSIASSRGSAPATS